MADALALGASTIVCGFESLYTHQSYFYNFNADIAQLYRASGFYPLGRGLESLCPYQFRRCGEMAYAADLKSAVKFLTCGFDSHRRHQFCRYGENHM